MIFTGNAQKFYNMQSASGLYYLKRYRHKQMGSDADA